MAPPVRSARRWWQLGCGCGLSVVAIAIASVFVVAGALVAIVVLWQRHERYRSAEHLAWPKSTPIAALVTRSPGGGFVTSAQHRDGALVDRGPAHPPTVDEVTIAVAECPFAWAKLTSQDHARCETEVLACESGDGRLLHEQYALRLRWLDAETIEVSWTELAGLGADEHRVWTRMTERSRVTAKHVGSGGCIDTRIEVVPL